MFRVSMLVLGVVGDTLLGDFEIRGLVLGADESLDSSTTVRAGVDKPAYILLLTVNGAAASGRLRCSYQVCPC